MSKLCARDQVNPAMNASPLIDLFTVTLLFGLLALAVVSDIEAMRIPNRICLCIVALYPSHVLASAAPIDWPGATAAAAAVFGLGLIPFLFRLMGGGDVKLMAALALWAGPGVVVDFMAVTFFLGGVMALLMISPFRFAMARTCEAIGREDFGEVLLNRAIPYAIAIAGGGYLTVGPRLLSAIG
ncbi:MAG: prepilin peptidase [Rhodospirillales bacterium]|nr:prepilin peptidase [Rhodospirillales bacterium]